MVDGDAAQSTMLTMRPHEAPASDGDEFRAMMAHIGEDLRRRRSRTCWLPWILPATVRLI